MGQWISNYSELRQQDIKRLLELEQRYKEVPFGARHRTGMDAEMEFLQARIAAERPMYETPDGLLIPRPTGIHTLNLAERMRGREAYQRPLRPMAEGAAINPETDLVPEVWYPAEVRLGGDGASLTSGAEWFERTYGNRLPKPMGKPLGVRRLPKSTWAELIASQDAPDLRQYYGVVQDQNSVGSCASEGGSGANHNKARSLDRQPVGDVELISPNPWFVYNTTSGGVDAGSSLEDTVAFLQRYGVATKKVWPRANGWRARPSAAAYEDALRYRPTMILAFPTTDTELLGTMILYGNAVYTGYSGHAWYMIWLLSTTQGIWMNSWGRSWGDNGMGTISFSSLRYGCYAFLNTSDAQQFVY